MISIVNYGLGNLASIVNMLNYLGIPSQIISRPNNLNDAQKIILPGVGAFDAGMKNLEDGGWIDALNKKILIDKVPVLGICLGMQLMTKASEEGTAKGLAYINGVTRRIEPPTGSKLKVPHMGWANIKVNKGSVFESEFMPGSRFYFAHTYAVELESVEDQWLTAEYGKPFCAGYCKENILGVQFHPEKSHKYGLDFFKKVYFEFQ